jgi:hypothetical protein
MFFQPDDFSEDAIRWEREQHEQREQSAMRNQQAEMEMKNLHHFLCNIPDRGLYFDIELQAIGVRRHGGVINVRKPDA